jgi:predicted nucleic acid-binding protein
LLIAAMCIANKLSLVTGNGKHFERFRRYGLTISPLKPFMDAVERSD